MQGLTPFGLQFFAFARSVNSASRFRLAPTPSGYLHAGNACNFILNWLAARLHPGASVLLRIDDLDADRKRPEYVQDVFDTLNWLGLDWDIGPRSADDFEQNWSQQVRLPTYFALLEELRNSGYLFACDKSRRQLARYNEKYPAEFREQGLNLDSPDVAWRVKTPENASFSPDFIVRRRDGVPAYQVASLVDDLQFEITHIIRGEDLADSTNAQIFLANCLNRSNFSTVRFLHHPLLLDEQGGKLSKSAGATALKMLHSTGQSPEDIFRLVAALLQISPSRAVQSANDLLRFFEKN